MKSIQDLISVFRAPSAEILAQRELEDAKRRELESLTAAEYYAAMAKVQKERIVRLTKYLKASIETA